MATQLPFDFAAEQDTINRRRQLAQELMRTGMQSQQGQMISGRFVAPNAIDRVLNFAGGMLMDNRQAEAQKNLTSDYNNRLLEGMEKYMTTRDGKAGGTMSDQQAGDLMNNDQAPELAEPVAANPRKAVLEAMTSGLPPLQQIGQMELQAMLRSKGRDPSMIKESGGQFYDLSSGKPVLLGGAEYGPTETIGGDLYQRGPGGKLVKLDNAPKVSTTVNNNPTQAGLKKYQEAVGEALAPGGKSRTSAEQANEGLTASVEALQAVNDGARQGIAQPAMQVVRKLAAELGVRDAATAPTDVLNASLKNSIFKELDGLGAQVSNSDRDFVRDFSGDLTTDPVALKRMLALRIAGQIKRVNQHNKQAAAFGRTVDDPNFESVAGTPLNIQIPDDEVAAMVDNVLTGKPTTAGMKQPTAGGASGKPMSAADYIRMKKGGQ